jgi:hypothetical protein
MKLLKLKSDEKEKYFKNASDSAILMNKKKNGVFCNYNNK